MPIPAPADDISGGGQRETSPEDRVNDGHALNRYGISEGAGAEDRLESREDSETNKSFLDKQKTDGAKSNSKDNTHVHISETKNGKLPNIDTTEPDTICNGTNHENGEQNNISEQMINKECNNLVSEVEKSPLLIVSDIDKSSKLTEKSEHPQKQLSRATSCYDNAPDGGWGWVVTFAAFMVGVILDGISFSFGIFYRELLVHFNESKSLTSWIISVMNGTYLGIGPIASVLVTVFGCRPVAMFGAILAAISFFLCTLSPNVQVMIVVYGLLGGAGLGLLYLPSIVTVGHYFKKKRALATGIAVCGSGIGGFVFAPLSEFLIEKYTWKGAMWIISAIVLHGIPIAVLLRPLEGSETYSERTRQCQNEESGACQQLIDGGEGGANVDKNKTKCCDVSSMFDFELLKSPTFLVYGLSCFLCMLGFFIPFTYIPDLADEFNMTSQQGAMLISIIGILNTGARVLVGWLADRPWADPLLINSVALLIGGAATMFVPMYSQYSIMATYCVVFGISIAVFVSYRSIIMAELLGIEKLTSSFGLVTMCQGLSAFIGAPIAGALSDHAGDYEGAFYLAGIAIGLSGAICFPLRAISRWENRHASAEHVANGVIYSSDIELAIKTDPVKV